MTVLVLLETILLAVLTVLVAGLLRAYATVLRRLHRLDGGDDDAGAAQFRLDDTTAVATPLPRQGWASGHDLSGESVRGELVSSRVVGVDHDTVLLFLSGGCASCQVFWADLAGPVALPPGTRLVVVTQGTEAESREAIQALAPDGLDVVMSTQAWRDYDVPGSPHVAYVEGRTGRVRGEGTGQSWAQVAQLIGAAQPSGAQPRSDKPRRDADVEAQIDRELLAAGILPGDPRLYE
jgi:hypothetical protein